MKMKIDTSKKDLFESTLKEKILMLDGAMGTMIQKFSLKEEDFRGKQFKDSIINLKGNNDVLSLTRPDVIINIHEQYLEAGSDIIETNTFSSTRISQKEYKLIKEDEEEENFDDENGLIFQMNKQSALIAREAINNYFKKHPEKKSEKRFVAGSVGPTNQTLSLSKKVDDPSHRTITFKKLANCYKEQIKGLIAGGIDVLLIETIFDTLTAKSAIYAALEVFEELKVELPVLISVTIDKSGRNLSGQTPEAFYSSIQHSGATCVGMNCGLGPKQMLPFVERMSKIALDNYILCYPNAGLPVMGVYKQTPDQMAKEVKALVDKRFINIVGGCCGSTPQHINAISKVIKEFNDSNLKPRQKLSKSESKHDILRLSGLNDFTFNREMSNFLAIGERCNVAGSIRFKKMILKSNYDKGLTVARKQVENGAQIIDVNMDEAMLDSKKSMRKFVNLIASKPEISKVPLMIDSSDFNVLKTGLECCQGKAIANSLSLKVGEEKFIQQAREIKKYGCAVVVMAFDEKGPSTTKERKYSICKRAYDILIDENKVGFRPEDIIFDPCVLTIGTGIEDRNNYGIEFLEACKMIKKNLPYAKIVGGVSNLSFSFKGMNIIREAMNSCFLYHAYKAGLDMAIVNTGNLPIYNSIDKELKEMVENLIFNKSKDATNVLIEYGQKLKGVKVNKSKKNSDSNSWRKLEIEKRIEYSLIKGINEYVKSDAEEARKKYKTSLEIVEIPLMNGMKAVGKLFGDGQMFLPQVLSSARVMKDFVKFLQPFIEEENKGSGSTSNGTILLATVRGDVHDIGKNIVQVVLGCNNYNVIDLGVMVEPEVILEKVKEIKPDILGLSGLITPSLHEMTYVAKMLNENNISLPIFIGGATTSAQHTAVKIAPYYPNGVVVHSVDASQSVVAASALLDKKNPKSRTNFIEHIKEQQKTLREEYYEQISERELIKLKQSKEKKFKIDWKNEKKPLKPSFLGTKVLNYNVNDKLIKLINWTEFFKVFQIKGTFPNNKYPQIFKDEICGKEAKRIYQEALQFLEEMKKCKDIVIKSEIGFYPANTKGEDIIVFKEDKKDFKELIKNENVLDKFFFLRQQDKSRKNNLPNSNYYSLSDFVAPIETEIKDYIGFFAAGVFGIDEKLIQKLSSNVKVSSLPEQKKIIIKALSDRLIEANSEYLHWKVRNEYIEGMENSSFDSINPQDLFKLKYNGIRPAIGYPSIPDHSEKKTLWKLFDVEKNIGVKLTESFAMKPASSVCGAYFNNPKSKYFAVGKIDKDQIKEYSKRKNIEEKQIEKLLHANLGYK